MHAIVITEPGPPQVLTSADVPAPAAAAGEVLIDVAATAVDAADLFERRAASPVRRGVPARPGVECSGTIAALGTDVSGWWLGDRVCALLTDGGYAERVAVPATQLLPVPAGVDLVEAAALPEAVCTVHSSLGMVAGLRGGRSVLVHQGGGAIGSTAIQWARARGVRVFATARGADEKERCIELGAELAIDHRREDFALRVLEKTGGRGVDAVLEAAGAESMERNLRALAADGHLIMIGLHGDEPASFDLRELMDKRASITATTLHARPPEQKARIVASVRGHTWPFVESGAIRPIVDRVLPLGEAAEAHRLLEAGELRGKIVLRV